MEVDFGHRESGRKGNLQFAAGDHIQSQPLLRHYLGNGAVKAGFTGKNDACRGVAAGELPLELAATVADVILGKDI